MNNDEETTSCDKSIAGDQRPGSRPSYPLELGRFAERVKELVGSMSARAFARTAGINDRSLRQYLAGETEPTLTALLAIAQAGKVSLDWLAGWEEPRAAAPRVEEPHAPYASPRAGYAYIPLYDVRARAGTGGELVEHERVVDVLAFKEEWIRNELRTSPADLRLIYVEGDSMEPDLRAGDIVLVDHTDTEARRDGIYAIRMDGALLVKQLQRLPGGIKVVSKNPSYEPFTVQLSAAEQLLDFAVIGRIVWTCRRV